MTSSLIFGELRNHGNTSLVLGAYSRTVWEGSGAKRHDSSQISACSLASASASVGVGGAGGILGWGIGCHARGALVIAQVGVVPRGERGSCSLSALGWPATLFGLAGIDVCIMLTVLWLVSVCRRGMEEAFTRHPIQ